MNHTESQSFLSSVKGRFSVRIEASFESAHYLYQYYPDGSDEPLHGHSWKVIVHLARQDHSVGKDGICIDFVPAGKKLQELAGKLDHAVINHIPDFKEINPTAEHIAKWICAGLMPSAAESGGMILKIEVFEGPVNAAVFEPEY